jgi:acetyl-CoA acyltransferase
MSNTVIAGYVRSPFHPAGKGALARVRPDDLAAQVVRGLLARTKLDPALVEDVVMGCAFPEGEQGLNVARLVGLLADLPISVGGMTVNRFCGSSMSAIHIAMGQIEIGAGEAFICAGVESMSRIPMSGFNPLTNPELAARSAAYMSMGDTAENVARQYQITRAEQDAFSLESQRKAAAARAEGRMTDEIVPITTKAGVVSEDGTLRPDTSLDALAGLKPAFDQEGTVTAGSSSPLTDGASAVLVTTEAFAQRHNLDVLARLRSVGVSGCAPEVMGLGPIQASQKALGRAGIGVDDLDVVEIN